MKKVYFLKMSEYKDISKMTKRKNSNTGLPSEKNL